ncbi:keratin-associated protein family [Trichomonas vaginalis G3]|uniref:keratin-associated protein family n=1 Tax=Trichomonas vaginalis (strain ATCC PRA-98 / G3) TaxID=412133 RepID=UPI0021E551F1|nr:keratin-associated protein family [Trichomonas vaginalis G3]KAI5514103.1 keratin-associated protein family [Trichomonas vaginalis G3]
MIKQQQPRQLKAQSTQALQTITYATYAYNSKTAEQTQRLKYGDLEIVLKNDHFEFVCKGGAVISNIKEILFMNSKIKGITDDITSIPPEEQRYYALNAFPKVLKIGRFNLNEEFIKGFLNDIMKKADKEYVASELMKKADKEYVNSELEKKVDKGLMASELMKKADKEYVNEKDNEIKEMVEWYHEWTSKILKTKADTGWVSGCLDLKADKTYVNDELNKKADKEYVDSELMKKANISFVNEEIKQSEVYFTPPFLNFMKSSDKTFDIDSFEWICFDGVTMYLFYTAGVLYYFKTNDFKNYESFTPSVLNPDTRKPIINPRILYVEYNNGKFMGMITVEDDFCPCYSFDCIQWFKCNLNQDAKFKYSNNPIRCVNNKWVLIYEVNQIFISEDGINYYMFSMMSSDLEIDYTSKWYYINNMYFILQNDKIYRSSSIPQGQFEQIFQADGDIEALCYGSNVYVLVSDEMVYSYPVSYNRHIYLSQDLSNWELVYSFTPKFTQNYRFTNLFYIDGYFIALGCGDLVNISSDGRNWSEITKFQDVRKAIFKNNTLILITRPVLNTHPNSILYNKFNIHNGLNTILEMIYPIGSIYTSMNSTNPATVLGFGTWKQIVDKFLYCANSSKETGGSKKINIENLPPHTHTGTTNFSGDHSHSLRDHPLYNSEYYAGNDVLSPDYNHSAKKTFRPTEPGGNHSHTFTTNPTGLGKDYMPPFMTVFAWYRVQ